MKCEVCELVGCQSNHILQVPSNSDISTTWPTLNDDQRRVPDFDENEKRRAAVARFYEVQQARRAMWRKRRGWETP